MEGYPTLVPAVDDDGNDRGCLNAPMVLAPLATYTGWNLRARGQGHGAKYQFSGSTIPFPETPEERQVTADPRASILERYPNAESYVEAVRAASRKLLRSVTCSRKIWNDAWSGRKTGTVSATGSGFPERFRQISLSGFPTS